MQIEHQKNTAYYLPFPMVDTSTPAQFVTGETVTDTAFYKDSAGAWTSLPIADTASEIGSTGVYEIDLTASELNHDRVIIKFTSSNGADTAFLFDMRAKLAEDLNDFDPATDTVANVTTVATLTGHTPQTGDTFAQLPANFSALSISGGGVVDASAISATAPFVQDMFTVDSGEVSGSEVTGSLVLEVAKVVWDRVLSGITHNIVNSAGRRLRALEFGDYQNGAVWIDTINGTPGTTDENGRSGNPVDNMADANTIASNENLVRFEVAPGSSITFLVSQSTQTFSGEHWTLALGGQDVGDTTIRGADVTGVATGTPGPHIEECVVGDSTWPVTHFHRCLLDGTVTLSATGVYCFERCGACNDPSIDFGAAVAGTTAHLIDYAGNIEILNLGQSGTDVVYLSGRGHLIINANCTGGTINIFGHFTIDDNSGGAVTINEDARFDVDLSEPGQWYIDGATGADTNTGRSRGNPFATIGAAVAAASSGDTLWITAGTYTEAVDHNTANKGLIMRARFGTVLITDSAGLTFNPEDYSEAYGITFRATGTSNSDKAVWGVGKKGLKFVDCIFDGQFDGGRFDACNELLIKRCTVTGTFDGLAVLNCDGVVIEDCPLISTDSTWAAGAITSHALLLDRTARGTGRVRNCYIEATRNDVTANETIAVNGTGDEVLEDCLLRAVQSGAGAGDVSGWKAGTDASSLTLNTDLVRCTFQTSTAGGGTARDINQAGAPTVRVIDSPYSTSQGTISESVDQTGDAFTAVGALNDLSAAEVNAEMLDVLTVDTFAQPGQESPAESQTIGVMMAYLYKLARNKMDQSATELRLYADDGSTVDQKATISEAVGTVTRGKLESGP